MLDVAQALLGCVVERETDEGLVAIRLSEVEAYAGALDPASHAFRGRTARNASMFEAPGHAYVYLSYGAHWCLNLVCAPVDTAEAVLLRAGEVIQGADLARTRRARRASRSARSAEPDPTPVRDRDLARGPGRLGRALGIDRALDGVDVTDPVAPLRVRPGRRTGDIRTGPRVGITVAGERPWRYFLDGDPTVSAYRPGQSRRRLGGSGKRSGR